ncbi:serine/threonine protein kinase [Nakamurella antarctica]|uniref:Serine/threonine protein kinase n=1 Tax=Nakamurella antarctica TaxID=1902245 RepID=A0A3G8ZXG6_9ACTN|nr:thioredoxin domain-containing protein [Nakamurella antarctica]AZI59114.1 serine/threonine protein kinase [Nakamurella antarctica]
MSPKSADNRNNSAQPTSDQNAVRGAKPMSNSAKRAAKSSVSAARKSSGISRTTLLIGGVTLLLVIAVVVLGVVTNNKGDVQYKTEASAPLSTATFQDGVITLATGTSGVKADIYEDALCPACGAFEEANGSAIGQAINDGSLSASYRTLAFLDGASKSKDYSTRASAAMICVASLDGAKPGVFSSFHGMLFGSKFQPKENGSYDYTNAELAEAAKQNGATEAADCISNGTMIEQATTAYKANSDALAAAGGSGTPSVVSGGKLIDTRSVTWLPVLLATAAK